MGLNANKVKIEGNGAKAAPLDSGTYPGTLVQVLDLGLQKQFPYKGEEKPPRNEIMLTYELTDEFMLDEDGAEIKDKPRFMSETLPFYSLSADLAKSTKRYYVMDPKEIHGGDFSALISTPVNLTIIQTPPKNGKIYNNITGISAVRAKDLAGWPLLINEPKVFTLDDPNKEVFMSFPQWIQDKIKDNLDFGGSLLEKVLAGDTPKEEAQKEVPQDDGMPEGNPQDEGDW